ncbi:TPA: hypothetical protein PFE20_000968 [Citrobacter freundii]|uniref:hypothetical protein n=1 Tax=Citrobacter freundii TaxID=546 RepID=UPI003312AEA3|nr:hypothetical protein [Citrobacter freundii]
MKKFAIKRGPRVSAYRYGYGLLHFSGKVRVKRGEKKKIMQIIMPVYSIPFVPTPSGQDPDPTALCGSLR